MPKVKNLSGQDLKVPALERVVLDGQVIEVTDEQLEGLVQQSIWEQVKEKS